MGAYFLAAVTPDAEFVIVDRRIIGIIFLPVDCLGINRTMNNAFPAFPAQLIIDHRS